VRSVIYSMGVSLDGYIVGADGDFDWAAPDEEVFRFVTNEVREVGAHLLGRRLYETMLFWETADQDPSLGESMLEWAAIWKPLPKVVFSTTLTAVQGTARLASSGLVEEIERLRAEPGEGDIAIGGAVGWISDSSRPVSSARESSTSATACRVSAGWRAEGGRTGRPRRG
jgi:hypothetical protein